MNNHDEWPSRIDRAINAGFDPGEDYGGQPVAAPGTPLPPSVVRHNHQGSPIGCDQCGDRCDGCGDRMCSKWGPEPAPRCPDHPTCVECADHVVHCRECGRVLAEVAQDHADDRAHDMAREAGR